MQNATKFRLFVLKINKGIFRFVDISSTIFAHDPEATLKEVFQPPKGIAYL